MNNVVFHVAENAPQNCGVYKMYNISHIPIYIGKAKNLKKRLQSYTRTDVSVKTSVMLKLVTSVELEVTENETQALILEASLIKKYRPKYNILLKDDKSRVYIKLSSHEIPAISRYRGKFERKSKLFGPFGYVQGSQMRVGDTVRIIMDFVCKVFKIRSCKDTKFKVHQAMGKPCMEYQIGTCSGPCAKKISKEDYRTSVREATRFMNGNYSNLKKEMTERVNVLAREQSFKEAENIKNRLMAIDSLKTSNAEVNFNAYENLDVIVLNEKQTAFEVFAIRNGYALGGNMFEINPQEGKTPQETMEAFLFEYYSQENLPPKEIFTGCVVDAKSIEAVFGEWFGFVPKIYSPQKGKHKAMLDFVYANLNFQSGVVQEKRDLFANGMELLARELGLSSIPSRVEVYDNSHTGGAFFMGAFIVASQKGFEPSQYRKFNAKFSKGGDDYAMMREVMFRRFQGMLANSPKPDLLIIDGGRGQFTAVTKALEVAGVDIPVVAIAKGVDRNAGNETFFMCHNTNGFKIANKQALYFIENLRDEAHRFVITSQRKKREKI